MTTNSRLARSIPSAVLLAVALTIGTIVGAAIVVAGIAVVLIGAAWLMYGSPAEQATVMAAAAVACFLSILVAALKLRKLDERQ